MGSAILSGLLSKRIARSSQIHVYDEVRAKAGSMRKRFGVKGVQSNVDLIEQSDVFILAIKPQDLERLGKEIKSKIGKKKIVISILAGTPIAELKRHLGAHFRLARAMPNLGAQVGEAVTAITGTHRSSVLVAERIFDGCGKVIRLKEKHFDLVTAVSGSGPAYFFLLMELLSRMGRKGGLSRNVATLLAIQTAVGASQLAQASSFSPEELRKRVTSKRGTTEAALQFLSKKGFGKIFLGGLNQALLRARALSRR